MQSSILSNGSKSSEVRFSLNNPYIKSEPEGCNNDSDYENHSRSDSRGNNNYGGSKGSCRDFTIQLNRQLIIALICYIFRQPQEQSNSSFVPYDSILKGFRSYRFHPRYKQEIGKHVYKLTIYSRDYNVDCKMCVFESQSRGHCNDDECTSQHWRDLQMSGKLISMITILFTKS